MTPGREPGEAAGVLPPGGGSRTARHLRRLAASSSLPAVLLFLALAAVFAYGHHRGGFFRLPANDRITFNNLAVAESLFSGRGPARFYRLTLDDDGAVTPEWHNRFPLGGHLLLKGATAVFGGGLAADLLAARVLMLAFMAGAALAAFAGSPAIWTGVARVDFERHRAALDSIVSGQAGPPAARGTFDLYRDGRRLLYHREDCREEDVAADFFLDLYPSAAESLPPRRREEGFEDLHFPFSNHGVVLDGQCLLLVTVPDYGIRRLTTGQFAGGEGPLWQVEIEPGG